MEVNNTFTSLIADLPYPNKKASASVNEKPVTSQQMADTKTVQETKVQNESKTNSNSVNILV